MRSFGEAVMIGVTVVIASNILMKMIGLKNEN